MENKPPSDYLTPDWNDCGRVHEWKNYISADLRAMWDTFTPAQKAAIAISADDAASKEEWD